jgi:lipopolysaccharide transport system ATP-binding protein
MQENQLILSVDSLTKEFQKDGKPLLALNGVSFDLNQGEVLGVIGRNGAGKSTLLKVLSQITAPSAGEVSYEGQLTSIIDIGTGFHADLSGEENIYLSALLFGYSKKEIKELYDQIVDFSGLHDFMQMPVKHYSSGMYLRLAFSIAFHSKISILLLDEVIAVGDTDFKRKCYAKIKELKARGVAIILVSHHLEIIVEHCDRCILLDDGKVLSEGTPLDIVNQYYEIVESNSGASIRSQIKQDVGTDDFSLMMPFPLKTEKYTIDNLEIAELSNTKKLTTSSEITLDFECSKLDNDTSFEIAITLTNLAGARILLDSYGFRKEYAVKPMSSGSYKVQVKIPADLLSAGVYRVGLILCIDREPVREFETVARFRIHPNDDLAETRGMGSLIRPKLNWEVDLIEKG